MSSKRNASSSADRLRLLRIMSVYALVTFLVTVAITLLIHRTPEVPTHTEIVEGAVQTEYVYVRPDVPPDTSRDTAVQNTQEVYMVREYMGKIGIFLSDGTLSEVLEVYTKTLPEADRRLLREGIVVNGKKQLNALIEDYTG